MKILFGLIILLLAANCSLKGECAGEMQVGIYNGDRRVAAVEDMAAALRAQGMAVEYVDKKIIEEGSIYKYDVLIFSGGWNATGWATYPLRLRLADYVDKGHGVLLTGFRCGPIRNMARPVFPEVGVAYNKVNTNGAMITDKGHAITMEVPERFYHSFWDHQVLRPGSSGRVLMKDTGGEALLVAGKEGSGRVVLCGFDFYKPEGANHRLLMNCIGWLGQAGLREHDKNIRESVELRVLRREKIWDYTYADRGFDAKHGILANIKYDYETPLDILVFKLRDYERYAKTESEKRLIV
ncbi:MAG: hypothetical protein PHT33_06680 [bacterium]|nr:hypothetical protein [bacterium]